MSTLFDALRRFAGRRILVIGDVMLDEYLRGSVQRISPEAPVPVVEVRSRTCMPGGAGNVATNLRALGAEVVLCGIVGDDESGIELRRLLTSQGIDCSGLVTLNDRPTTLKTRIFAGQQQVVRVDREVDTVPNGASANSIVEAALARIDSADAVLLQDYDKGVLSPLVIGPVRDAAKAHGRVVAVDPKRRHFFDYGRTTVFKPNLREASEALGVVIRSGEDEDRAGAMLLERIGCDVVLLTLGDRGMAIYRPNRPVERIAARAVREVYDVTGAGDTVISTVTVGLAAGGSVSDAVQLAAVAASLTVQRLGAQAISAAEIEAALREDGRE